MANKTLDANKSIRVYSICPCFLDSGPVFCWTPEVPGNTVGPWASGIIMMSQEFLALSRLCHSTMVVPLIRRIDFSDVKVTGPLLALSSFFKYLGTVA